MYANVGSSVKICVFSLWKASWHVFNLEVVKMYDVYSEMPGSNGSVGDVYLIFEHLGELGVGESHGMAVTCHHGKGKRRNVMT